MRWAKVDLKMWHAVSPFLPQQRTCRNRFGFLSSLLSPPVAMQPTTYISRLPHECDPHINGLGLGNDSPLVAYLQHQMEIMYKILRV